MNWFYGVKTNHKKKKSRLKRISGWPVWPGCGRQDTPDGLAHKFGWRTPCRRGYDHMGLERRSLCSQNRSCIPEPRQVENPARGDVRWTQWWWRWARCGHGVPEREETPRRWSFRCRTVQAVPATVWSEEEAGLQSFWSAAGHSKPPAWDSRDRPSFECPQIRSRSMACPHCYGW